MKRTTVCFIILTLLFVCAAALCAACTARGQEAPAGGEEENWYREQELLLTEDVRKYLNGEGFRDSGVSLTRVVSPEGTRSYTFTIHHRRIDRMAERGRRNLEAELAALTEDFVCDAPGEDCEFSYEFLIVEEYPGSL